MRILFLLLLVAAPAMAEELAPPDTLGKIVEEAARLAGEAKREYAAAKELPPSLGRNERLSKTSAVAMQGLAVAAVYSQVFKFAAWSNRPSQDDQSHRFFAYDQSTQGMPSGHSFSAFTLAEIYGAEYGRVLPYTLAGVIAYSRVYNRAHWPSDVFAGAVLGIIAGVQTRNLAEHQGAPRMRFSLMPKDDGAEVSTGIKF